MHIGDCFLEGKKQSLGETEELEIEEMVTESCCEVKV
jgi:hypothetical protein